MEPKGAFQPLGLDKIAKIAGKLHCITRKSVHSSLRELFPDLRPAKRQSVSNKYVALLLQRGGQIMYQNSSLY